MKKIFFTYSNDPDDVELYKEFYKHFATYARSGFIKIVDRDEVFKLTANGQDFAAFLKDSDVAIPLLSVDYMGDKQCLDLLDKAIAANKIVVPVLLRDCDWTALAQIKELEENLLPEDRQSVKQYVTEGKEDEVFMLMAKKVKGIVLPELADIQPRNTPKTFYYILSGIVVTIGILLTIFSQARWGDWRISAAIMLMFIAIALLSVKNYLFPTKFRVA